MRTKNEIFDLLMGYLDMGIAMGFYTKEETKEIENLEKEYWIQSNNQVTGGDTSSPGRVVNFLIIEKTIDKFYNLCYTIYRK